MGSAAVGATLKGRAVEIADSIHDEAGVWVNAVEAAAKAPQDCFRPSASDDRRRHQLEHRPIVLRAANDGCAIQIATGIHDQGWIWVGSVSDDDGTEGPEN
jgi:hypothetical protein